MTQLLASSISTVSSPQPKQAPISFLSCKNCGGRIPLPSDYTAHVGDFFKATCPACNANHEGQIGRQFIADDTLKVGQEILSKALMLITTLGGHGAFIIFSMKNPDSVIEGSGDIQMMGSTDLVPQVVFPQIRGFFRKQYPELPIFD